jgi:hypothetical protein
MMHLYGHPISRKVQEARDAIRSPAGQTPAQIAEHLLILDWHGDDGDQLRANDFRRDHGLPDPVGLTLEVAPVIAAPIWPAEGPFSAADRFPKLRPPASPKPRAGGVLARLLARVGLTHTGGASGRSGLRRGEVAAILKSETEGNE